MLFTLLDDDLNHAASPEQNISNWNRTIMEIQDIDCKYSIDVTLLMSALKNTERSLFTPAKGRVKDQLLPLL